MARAGKIENFNETENRLAREYLAGALEPIVGRKLEVDGPWLRNPASGSTYNTLLIGKPDPQLGMVRLPLMPDGSPEFGGKGATWIVLHDPHANKVFISGWEEFITRARESARTQHEQTMMRVVPRQEGGFIIMFNLDWAVSIRLVRFAVSLKGSYAKWREKRLAVPEDFVHLHNHSTYSLLDGASSIEGIADAAIANGQKAIALTDHGYMFGSFKHWQACTRKGIKPLMGVEAYVVDDVTKKYVTEDGQARRWEYHQTLLAMNQTGWENLCRLMTDACRDHVHYVPRIDHKMLLSRNEGIICLTGCFKGMAAHYLQRRVPREGDSKLPWWLEYNPDRAVQILRDYKAAFGDRLYGEVMNIDFKQYVDCVPELLNVLDFVGIPKVATNDNHYEREEDAILQSVLTRISTQRVDEIGGQQREKGVYFIRSRAEIAAGAPWMTNDMLNRTCEVADRCNLSFKRDDYLFPHFDITKDKDWQAFQASRTQVAVPAGEPSLPKDPVFDGETYEPERDQVRLNAQLHRVYDFMKDAQWRTLAAISEAVGDPQPSISARLRDLRKEKFGSHHVNRKYLDNGLWVYQLIVKASGAVVASV